MKPVTENKKQHTHPLSRDLLVGSVVFILFICLFSASIAFFIFRSSMMEHFSTNLAEIITMTQSRIDPEVIKETLETREETPEYKELTDFLDQVKRSFLVDHIVLSTPVKTEDGIDVIVVASGLLPEEREGKSLRNAPIPKLGDSIRSIFSPESLQGVYDEFIRSEDIRYSFIKTDYSTNYIAGIPIRDAEGESVAMLTAGIPVSFINSTLLRYIVISVIAGLILSLFFFLIATAWLRKRVILPIGRIEKAAIEFEEKSRGGNDPGVLLLDIPEIKTGDELQSLSEALREMTYRMKAYVDMLLQSQSRMDSLEQDLSDSRIRAIQLGEMAIRDDLTGIRNKTAYDLEAEKLASGIDEGDTRFGIAVADLNGLKKINSDYGREKGDKAIIKLCFLVCDIFAHSPVFRVGSDEFYIILKGSDYKNIDALIRKFDEEIALISKDTSLEPWERISAAAGYAFYESSYGKDMGMLVRRANERMYERKSVMKVRKE